MTVMSIEEHSEQLDNPTITMYKGLQEAFDFMNDHLFVPKFGTRLPNCLLTLRATGRTHGYFSERRFVGENGVLTHEIALNPAGFANRSVEISLSTLAHQMCHLLQFVDGSGPNPNYHNKAFADRMEAIGLITTHDGTPSGKRVHQTMTHRIDPAGVFITEIRKFLATGFRARWADRFSAALPEPWSPSHAPLTAALSVDAAEAPSKSESVEEAPMRLYGGADNEGEEGDDVTPTNDISDALRALSDTPDAQPDEDHPSSAGKSKAPTPELAQHVPMEESLAERHAAAFNEPGSKRTKGATRHKYECNPCKINVWGKPKLNIHCGECGQSFVDKG